MTRTLSAHALGATLYMPATRLDILDVVCGHKLPDLRSLVICLEDAVAIPDVEFALNNLLQLLQQLKNQGGRQQGPMLFVRPRHTEMAQHLAQSELMQQVDGFVAPKLTLASLTQWLAAVEGTELYLMPTLETAEVFDPSAMSELRSALLELAAKRILALRIGGNDLLSVLGMRRNPLATLYEGPLAYLIGMLVGMMGSAGFCLTGPVCETLDNPSLLAREAAQDVAQGLVGKTAIHPNQIATIHAALQVSPEDYEAAQRILHAQAPAVFQFAGAMCEPATHSAWAQRILSRAEYFGVRLHPVEWADYRSA